MKRDFTNILEKWSNKENRKPLIVMGARQIGKTWIIDDFCKNNFKHYLKLNFFEDSEALTLCNNSDFKTVRNNIQLRYNISFDDNDTIIFFDEIQLAPYLIQHLKFFKIEYPTAHIVCAGSLLGVSYRQFKQSFPIGYVQQEVMYPMSFKEFLIATGDERYIPIIESAYKTNKALSEDIHNALLYIYHVYLYIGGMPEVIKDYIDKDIKDSKDLAKLDNKNIIKNIIKMYKTDMSKYLDYPSDALRIEKIYDNIPGQLAKSNPKFMFSKLAASDNRKENYLSSIDWLDKSSIVYFCYQISKCEYPIKAYIKTEAYKIFLNDTGILNNLVNIDVANMMMDGNYMFKGVVAENYVASQLIINGFDLLYYTEKSNGADALETDFVIQYNGKVIPIEVKANDNTQSKSLKSYINKFNPDFAIRISSKNFGMVNKIKSVPLYATFCIANDN